MTTTETKAPKPESSEELPELLKRGHPPLPLWKKVLCLAGAAVLFVLGIVFWLVPVVTGIPFHVGALILVGLTSDRVRGWVNALDRRLPHPLRKRLRRLRKRKAAE